MKKQTKKKYKLKVDFDFNIEYIFVDIICFLGFAAGVALIGFLIDNIIHTGDYSLIFLIILGLFLCAVTGFGLGATLYNEILIERVEIKPPLSEEEKAARKEARAKAKAEEEARAAEARSKSALSAHDWLMDRYPTEADLPANTTYKDLEQVVLDEDKRFLMDFGPNPVNTTLGFEVTRHDHRESAIRNYCACLPYYLALQQHEREVKEYEERYNIAKEEENQTLGE